MNNLYARLKKRYDMTISDWRNDCRFSRKLACFRFLANICGRANLTFLAKWAKNKKEKWILNYLQTSLAPVIEKYKSLDDKGTAAENAPVWGCWWTGEETAPPLVRQCICSIRKNAGTHPVHLITQDNYSAYLDIPSFLLNRLKNKQIGFAHFADYLRVCLLEKYGGLWLDATIFCSQKIPDYCFNMSFFTCKSELKTGFYLSDFQWVTFVLGAWKGNIVYAFLKEAFEAYWKNTERAIDYLFFDDLIYLAKENIPAIKRYLDSVQINNIHRDDLQAAMNECRPAEDFCDIIKSDTALYKLSWRETYSETTADGKPSIYSYFLNMEF